MLATEGGGGLEYEGKRHFATGKKALFETSRFLRQALQEHKMK